MAITDRASLAAAVAEYLHRTDLTVQIVGFIDLATKRLGRDLRSQENETVAVYDLLTNPQILPADFAAIRDLSYSSGSGIARVRSGSLQQMADYSGSRAGGRPGFYKIRGRMLEVAPTRLGEYNLDYFTNPADLITDISTNSVLAAYPYLYLYATLYEAFFFTQEGQGLANAKATYESEVKQINNQASASMMGSNAAGG
jgi:hypothetical protein